MKKVLGALLIGIILTSTVCAAPVKKTKFTFNAPVEGITDVAFYKLYYRDRTLPDPKFIDEQAIEIPNTGLLKIELLIIDTGITDPYSMEFIVTSVDLTGNESEGSNIAWIPGSPSMLKVK